MDNTSSASGSAATGIETQGIVDDGAPGPSSAGAMHMPVPSSPLARMVSNGKRPSKAPSRRRPRASSKAQTTPLATAIIKAPATTITPEEDPQAQVWARQIEEVRRERNRLLQRKELAELKREVRELHQELGDNIDII